MATIKDIARKLNVSTSTVSYALNGGPRTVPEEVRERVLHVARELDYRPNRVARSLVTRSSGAIGVVPPSVDTNVFASPFVQQAWNAIVNEAEALGQDLLLFTGHDRNSPDEPGTEFLDGRIDGVVFIAPRSDAKAVSFLATRNFPFTSIAGGDGPGLNYTVDNFGGVRKAIEHLVTLGHKHIGHVMGIENSPDGAERTSSYFQVMDQFGLGVNPEQVFRGEFTVDGGQRAADRLLEIHPLPTALFLANDEMAIGMCLRLRQAGLRVPEDISVVGFDDSELSFAFSPPLTTIRQPVEAMATAAMRSVVAISRCEEPIPSSRYPAELIIRDSTAPVGGRA